MGWTEVIDAVKQVTSNITGIRKVLIRDEERPFHDPQMVFMELDVAPIGEDILVYCENDDGSLNQVSLQTRRLAILFSFESTQHRPDLLGPVLASKFIAGIRGQSAQETLSAANVAMQDIQATQGSNYSHDGRRISVGQALAFFTVALKDTLETGIDYFDKVTFEGDLLGGAADNHIGPVLVGPVNPQPAPQLESERSFMWTVPNEGTLTDEGSRTWSVTIPLSGMVDGSYIVVAEQRLVTGALKAVLTTQDETTTGFTLVAVNSFLIPGTQVRFFLRDSDES